VVDELIRLSRGKEFNSTVIVSGNNTFRIILDPGSPNKRGKGLAAFSIHDITDSISKEKALSMLATKDIVTGLSNRNNFQNELGKVERASVTTENPLGAVIADVDNFKPVNDKFGHVTGDYYLALIGLLSAMSVRGSQNILKNKDRFSFLLDTVTEEGRPFREAAEYLLQNLEDFQKRLFSSQGEGSGQTGELKLRQPDLVARYGGDEFAVILRELGKRGVSGMTTYLHRVDKLVDSYNELVKSGVLQTPEISISFGGVMIDGEYLYKITDRKLSGNYVEGEDRYFVDRTVLKPDWTPDNIIGAADELMYSAKEQRKRMQGRLRGRRSRNPWPIIEAQNRRRFVKTQRDSAARAAQADEWMERLEKYIDPSMPTLSPPSPDGSKGLIGSKADSPEKSGLLGLTYRDAALRRLKEIAAQDADPSI
jgi:GGDEF domain-containing protein